MAEVVIDKTSATPAEHVRYAWREYQRANRARRIMEQRLSAARKTEAYALGRLVRVCQRLKLKAETFEEAAATALRAVR